jgi:Peptidase family M1 domain
VFKNPKYQEFIICKHCTFSQLKNLLWLLAIFVTFSCTSKKSNNLYIPVDQQIAIKKGTRSQTGLPGPKYFQNRADYSIKASIDPAKSSLSGEETIHYYNYSPDTLNRLVINIFQDLYRKGNVRNYPISPDDVTYGVLVKDVKINGKKVKGNYIDRYFTLMVVDLVSPMLPSSNLEISLSWQFRIPTVTKRRMGMYDNSSFFIAYWFPHIAVYDDLSGWDKFPYMGIQEFYNDYSNFDVEIAVPNNYIVWGTGLLQNTKELFTDFVYSKILSSHTSDTIIHIIDDENYKKHDILKTSGSNNWKFKASSVTDFAFATSDHYLWDAASVLTDEKSGIRSTINAVYRKESNFKEVAFFARKSVSLLSKEIYGVAFPFPQITIFEGGLDGMEFPMMANDESFPTRKETLELTFHEIAHSYFPFLVGTNERKYAWMDEGLTEMYTKEISRYFDTRESVRRNPVNKINNEYYTTFNDIVGKELDVPLMVPSTEMLISYETQVYDKASLAFSYLKEFLGKEKFQNALQEFIRRWAGKHPTPVDFFATLNASSGQDLNWFIKPWFYEIGTADLSLTKCSVKSGKICADIINHGSLPVPIKLNIYFIDGSKDSIYYKADVWKKGDTLLSVSKVFKKPVLKLVLGDDEIPDSNKSDNVFIPKDQP